MGNTIVAYAMVQCDVTMLATSLKHDLQGTGVLCGVIRRGSDQTTISNHLTTNVSSQLSLSPASRKSWQ